MAAENPIQDWNEKYPIGTPVVVLRGLGRKVMSYTSSPAKMEEDVAVVYLSGFSVPFPLERCRAIED